MMPPTIIVARNIIPTVKTQNEQYILVRQMVLNSESRFTAAFGEIRQAQA